jgi:hypothetical protein
MLQSNRKENRVVVKRAMISTIDNPHSPFDDFPAWYDYDVSSGYHSTEFLGRLVHLSDQQSDADYDLAVEQAVDEIVRENVLGIYIKVEKEFEE